MSILPTTSNDPARAGKAITAVLASAVFSLTFVGLAPLLYVGVLVLAGPHSDALPAALGGLVVVVAWVLLIGLPTLAARRVLTWRARRRGGAELDSLNSAHPSTESVPVARRARRSRAAQADRP